MKKQIWLVGLFACLLFGLSMAAVCADTITQITTDPNDQLSPKISGDKVVWKDMRESGGAIYLYDLAAKTESRIAGYEGPFAISDGKIARNSGTYLYVYDIATGQERQIAASYYVTYSNLDISGNKVVWVGRSVNEGSGMTHLFLYDLETSVLTSLKDVPYTTKPVAISGNKIAWCSDMGFYVYDLATGIQTELIHSSYPQTLNFAISGNKIAVQSYYYQQGTLFKIEVYDLDKGLTPQEIQAMGAPVDSIDISGNTITWAVGLGPIYRYDLTTGTKTMVDSFGSVKSGVAIDGNRIVWADNRNLVPGSIATYQNDIYMAEVVAPSADTTPPTTPVISATGSYSEGNSVTLSASWSSSDPESGIVEYQYAIGNPNNITAIVGWTSVGTSTSVTRSGLPLMDGSRYCFGVKAKNGAGLWSVISLSNLVLSDSSSPQFLRITDEGAYTANTTTLSASWQFYDSSSGVAEHQYSIGTAKGLSDVVGWTSTGTTTSVTKTGLSLVSGKIYYFNVRAKNGVGLWSSANSSDGIKVDTIKPTTPIVTAPSFTTYRDRLSASWSSSDLESGITEYQYAIGTSKGGTGVVGWTSTGTNKSITKTGLTLERNEYYYFSVKSKNGAGLWSSLGYSGGTLVK